MLRTISIVIFSAAMAFVSSVTHAATLMTAKGKPVSCKCSAEQKLVLDNNGEEATIPLGDISWMVNADQTRIILKNSASTVKKGRILDADIKLTIEGEETTYSTRDIMFFCWDEIDLDQTGALEVIWVKDCKTRTQFEKRYSSPLDIRVLTDNWSGDLNITQLSCPSSLPEDKGFNVTMMVKGNSQAINDIIENRKNYILAMRFSYREGDKTMSGVIATAYLKEEKVSIRKINSEAIEIRTKTSPIGIMSPVYGHGTIYLYLVKSGEMGENVRLKYGNGGLVIENTASNVIERKLSIGMD